MDNINISVVPDQNFFLQIAATLILYFVMRHFLYKPAKEFLDRRKAYVENNISESEKAKEESLRLKEEYETKLKDAKTEASEILASARALGEDVKAKAVKESKELAKKEYEKGMLALEGEKKKALSSLNDQIVDMTILATEKVLRKNINSDVNRSLVESFVSDLEGANE